MRVMKDKSCQANWRNVLHKRDEGQIIASGLEKCPS
ncbi:hypothetical protein QFZ31_004386 [Neobacillus niacini]|nr:hypothetical protein [Neobacillus niacini]